MAKRELIQSASKTLQTVTIARLMKPRALTVVAAAAAWLLLVPTAHAWQRITSAKSNTQTGEVSLLRTADGVLHVAWRSTTASYRHRVDHRAIAADGTVAATNLVSRDWLEMSDPGLALGTDGLRVFFGGLHTAHPDEINTELNTAVSVDGGATWGLQEGSIVGPGTAATDTPVSAATQGDGVALATWANATGTWIHRGLDPSVAPVNLQPPLGPFGTRPGVATIGTRTVVGWFSYSGSAHGVYVQEVAPDGTPSGNAVAMPGTAGIRSAMPGRTPVASRVGGKVFVAYAAGNGASRRILLWSVGSSSARVIARASGPAVATVTADPSGRVWVAWTTRVNGRDRVMARRSNATATSFGAIVDAGRPSTGAAAKTLDANAAGDDLDVFAGYARSGSSRVATYYSRVSP
jgi:hypothetical protein